MDPLFGCHAVKPVVIPILANGINAKRLRRSGGRPDRQRGNVDSSVGARPESTRLELVFGIGMLRVVPGRCRDRCKARVGLGRIAARTLFPSADASNRAGLPFSWSFAFTLVGL